MLIPKSTAEPDPKNRDPSCPRQQFSLRYTCKLRGDQWIPNPPCPERFLDHGQTLSALLCHRVHLRSQLSANVANYRRLTGIEPTSTVASVTKVVAAMKFKTAVSHISATRLRTLAQQLPQLPLHPLP